ncbi:MAG: sulfatase, partial [Phycisphaerae bacterium]
MRRGVPPIARGEAWRALHRIGPRACPLVLIGLLAVGCKPSGQRAAKGPSAAAEIKGEAGMNVLFVSVDTTRADSIGCYGHPVVKTPNIDRLAAEGTRFTQCISSIPITLPSHSCMMTGSYQYVHGARDNGGFVLDDANETLAEQLRAAGYATHAELGSVILNRQYGLNQGFDTYGDLHRRSDEPDQREPDGAASGEEEEGASKAESSEPLKAPEAAVPWDLMSRKAKSIADAGIQLLRQNADRPFFIFLHFYDPHQPNTAPKRFADQYKDGYLAEIAYFDEQFGRIMDELRRLKLAKKTLVVFTSDHGEGRGQHGEGTHSYFLYDTTLHVPLILWNPGRIPAGRVVTTQVRLIDLAPTVLAFLGLPGTSQMQGVSLLPVLANPESDLHLAAYGDTLAPQLVFGYSALRSLRMDGWKYIHAPTPELYHVAEDPLEMFNLAASNPERVGLLRDRLKEVLIDSPDPPGSRLARTKVDEKELKKLWPIVKEVNAFE